MVVSGVISPAKVVADLKKEVGVDGTKYTLSLGSEEKLPTRQSQHEYGCRIAAAANSENQRKSEQGLGSFERIFYRGCYRMHVGAIHDSNTELFSLEVHDRPLPNLEEHCDLEMRRTQTQATKGEVSTDRTKIIVRLQNILTDPNEHICDCDMDFVTTIEAIKLIAN